MKLTDLIEELKTRTDLFSVNNRNTKANLKSSNILRFDEKSFS